LVKMHEYSPAGKYASDIPQISKPCMLQKIFQG